MGVGGVAFGRQFDSDTELLLGYLQIKILVSSIASGCFWHQKQKNPRLSRGFLNLFSARRLGGEYPRAKSLHACYTSLDESREVFACQQTLRQQSQVKRLLRQF